LQKGSNRAGYRYIIDDITMVLLDARRAIRHRGRMARLSIRVFFETPGSAVGPGMAQLLEAIAEHGSIRRAAAAMDMSYRKAWLLIQKLQKTFDGPIVSAEVGGVAGGGTKLTELGSAFLKLYRRVESRAADATKTEREALSAMVRANAEPRRAGRRKRSAKN
jgi:molybdate transport system regulatory protein